MIDQNVSDWIGGLVGVLIVLGTFIGFYIQVKKVKTDSDKAANEKIEKAVEDAKIETESAIEFRQLKENVAETNKSILSLTSMLTSKMTDVDLKLTEHDRCLDRLSQTTDFLNKRMDEHRMVDHKGLKTKEENIYETLKLDQ